MCLKNHSPEITILDVKFIYNIWYNLSEHIDIKKCKV